jgi:hypothetical protein
VISVGRYFFEPFASWSWRKDLAAAAAAAASSFRVWHGADLCLWDSHSAANHR